MCGIFACLTSVNREVLLQWSQCSAVQGPAIHAGERIPIDDGFHQFSISYSSLCNIIITIWGLWFLQIVCLLVYYATHPSSVATHPKHYATKMKVIWKPQVFNASFRWPSVVTRSVVTAAVADGPVEVAVKLRQMWKKDRKSYRWSSADTLF